MYAVTQLYWLRVDAYWCFCNMYCLLCSFVFARTLAMCAELGSAAWLLISNQARLPWCSRMAMYNPDGICSGKLSKCFVHACVCAFASLTTGY